MNDTYIGPEDRNLERHLSDQQIAQDDSAMENHLDALHQNPKYREVMQGYEDLCDDRAHSRDVGERVRGLSETTRRWVSSLIGVEPKALQ